MVYVKQNEAGGVGVFPYSVAMLKADNPDTSFPAATSEQLLESYNVFPVTVLDPPQFDGLTQEVTLQSNPVKVNGAWEIGYDVSNLPVDVAANNVNARRDELLSACDWTQLSDAPVDQAAWATYRVALRDVPQQEGFPHNVVWPVKPEATQ